MTAPDSGIWRVDGEIRCRLQPGEHVIRMPRQARWRRQARRLGRWLVAR